MAAFVLRSMLIGMAIGVVAELLARVLNLWVYRQPQTPLLNVVAVFGFTMGGIASLVPVFGLLPACALAFVIGLSYEVANLWILDWWFFPGERVGFIRGHTAILLVLAVLWGLLPAMIVVAQTGLPGLSGSARSRQMRLRALTQREKQLLGKLDALRQRERGVESKLERVRRKKQYILDHLAVRRLESADASATPATPRRPPDAGRRRKTE